MPRRVSVIFGLAFVIEIIIFSLLLCQVYSTLEQLELLKTLSSTLAAFGTILVTTALVYHNFRQKPELRMLDVIADPRDGQGNSVLSKGYRLNVYQRVPGGRTVLNPNPKPQQIRRFPYTIKEIKCDSPPSTIRIAVDVGNIGLLETAIHEYTVEELHPDEEKQIFISRERLRYQERVTLDFPCPLRGTLKGGLFGYKIDIFATTEKRSKNIWIRISKDLKTITWCSHRF